MQQLGKCLECKVVNTLLSFVPDFSDTQYIATRSTGMAVTELHVILHLYYNTVMLVTKTSAVHKTYVGLSRVPRRTSG